MENTSQIGIMIGFGCLAMLVLALLIILSSVSYRRRILQKENRIQALEQEKRTTLFRTTVEAEEEQRKKVAADLHDEITPMLVGISLQLENRAVDLEKGRLKPDHL